MHLHLFNGRLITVDRIWAVIRAEKIIYCESSARHLFTNAPSSVKLRLVGNCVSENMLTEGKKLGEMTKEELEAFSIGIPAITREDKEEYAIPDVEMNVEGYSDDPEVIEKSLQCLGDKYLAAATIAEAQKKKP